MNLEAADALNEYGLPELPFVIVDPENTRYVLKTAQAAYIKEDSAPVGFIVYHEQQNKMVIYYLVFDEKVCEADAEAFLREFCSKKEVFALTYDCNKATQILKTLGFYQEPGLQFMEMNPIPHFGSSYGLEYLLISKSRIPSKISKLYNKCFSASDGKRTMEKFVHDTFPRTGSSLIMKREGENIGFWIDVIYFENMCFNCWIGVVPRHRRKGYGAQLAEYALNVARNKGCTKAGLLVNPRNEAAVKFYQQIGFERKWGRIHWQSEPE